MNDDQKVKWVKIDQIKDDLPPIRHPELPKELIERIEKFQKTFGEIYPVSVEKTIDNFKRDTHPEREVKIWEAMAETWKSYTEEHANLSQDEKKELLGILLDGSSAPEHPGGFKYFSQENVKEIAGRFAEAYSK